LSRKWIAVVALLALGHHALAANGAAPHVAAPAKTSAPKEADPLVSTNAMAPADYAACLSQLGAAKVAFEPVGDAREQGCALSGAVRLTAVSTSFGEVALPAKPTLLCGFARQFSGWVSEVAAPLTLAYSGQRLVSIETGPGFACRPRTDKPAGTPSEHARGDAIDVVAFVPAGGRPIKVKEEASDSSAARGLSHALRMTGCGYFTTVLGPGANAAHAEHLHFDSMQHGATPNYRICE
jgi:hypothetical protein